jgi:hypothetical protein
MTSTRSEELRKAIEQAVQPWPASSLGPGSDFDLEAFYVCAQRVERELQMSAPVGLPPKKNGIALVGHVGQHLLDRSDPMKWDSIRDIPHEVLSQRVLCLANTIQRENLLSFDEPGNFLAAFYTYHGFFNMAKVTRPTCVDPTAPGGERALTLQERMTHYRWVEGHWRQETERGNLWVEYGASITRFVELKQRIIDNWVPFGSPYWNE